ncbi:hypothetical protein ACKUB1_05610 [Methanospirillum stamsii]|uniref:Uncharacterized protein n=1 Tax=Methanospirillum stamsii TaxID=1277351 RepID=A0A2V2N755_9EURY|nr:hypothetical protein [Methanospirillum stamsii]PWR71103.1 hypothetical protein DLD82_14510 [Methanospirillum stamsii]
MTHHPVCCLCPDSLPSAIEPSITLPAQQAGFRAQGPVRRTHSPNFRTVISQGPGLSRDRDVPSTPPLTVSPTQPTGRSPFDSLSGNGR